MKTIFEKIINGELPANKIYEDKDVIAIFDIDQSHPGHSLVIPKVKSVSLNNINEESLNVLMKKTIDIAKKIMHNQETDDWQLVVNNGSKAGQEIFYTHIHIYPSNWDKEKYKK